MAEVVFPSVPAGSIYWEYNATANDSDKSFTVPAGHVWQPMCVHAELVCTATVGNRTLTCVISDDSANIVSTPATVAAATASQSAVLKIQWMGGGINTSTTSACRRFNGTSPDVGYNIAFGTIFLPEGFVVRFYDSAAVDAAADDLTIAFAYIDYPVREL